MPVVHVYGRIARVFERFTEDSRRTIQLARESALRLGKDRIDGLCLVLAMFAEERGVAARALAAADVDGHAFVRSAGLERVRTGEIAEPGKEVRFEQDARSALEQALRESLRLGDGVINSGHLLLGVVAAGGEPVRVMTELGAPPEAIRTAVVDTLREIGPTQPAIDRAALPPPAAGVLPTPSTALRTTVLTFVAYLVAAAITLLTVPADDRAIAAVGYLAIVIIDSVLQYFVRQRALRQAVNRLNRTLIVELEPPAILIDVVGRYGVDRLRLRAQATTLVRDRSFRVGSEAWIILSAVTLNSPALRFVLAHEVAHILRDDSTRRRLGFIWSIAFLAMPVISPSLLTLVVAIGSAAVVLVTERWISELACDAVGVRWAGHEPFQAWVATVRDRFRQPVNQTPRARLRRLVGTLTHPPLSVRSWWAGRVRPL